MAARRLRRITATLVVVAGLAVIGALATGEVALVTTHGVSMEPTFHTGDLAVIVPSATYHVGEVVGYHSPLLHIVVLHRIVAEHHGLFTYKGDNNSFLDPVRTPASAIEGRLWLHIAHGGVVLGWLRSPPVLGFLAFLMIALGAGGAARRRSRGPAGVAGRRPVPERAAPGSVGVGWWPIATALALVAVFALITLVAWVSPATRSSPRAVPYDQKVSFSYAATAPAGVTYPTGRVTTGDPVFLQLVRSLDVTVHYALRAAPAGQSSGAAQTVSGTIAASASLEGPGGWTGPLAALPPVSFSGLAATVDVPLDLTRISTLERAFTAETGVPLDDPEIVLTPTVRLRGTIDGESLGGLLAPSLSFRVDGSLLSVIGTTSAAGGDSTPALTVVRSGSVAERTHVAGRLSVLGRSIAVTSARRLGLGGLILSILAAVAGFIWWSRRRRMDETARIHAAYGHDLVAVATSPTPQAPLVVEVATFEELARLARRYDCLILEHVHQAGHAYYVESGTTLYRCGVEPAPPGPAGAVDLVAVPTVDHAVAASPTTASSGRRRLRPGSPPAADDPARMADDVELLTCLARAELVSGVGDARTHLREAVILARKAELFGPLVEALVVNGRTSFDQGQESDPEKIEFLHEALDHPGETPARRARLLGALAVESIFATEADERGGLLDQAGGLARQTGDSRALVDVATATFVARPRPTWSLRRFESDRTLIAQAVEAALTLGDPAAVAATQSSAAFCALVAGDGPAVRQALSELTDTAGGGQNQIAWRTQLDVAQSVAILEGRLADAEELGLEASAVHSHASLPDRRRALAQLALRREQDRLAELIPALAPDDGSSPAAALSLATRAFVLAETGRGDDAAILLHRAEATGWAGLPDDLHWSTAVALWSEVAAQTGDRQAAAALHQILEPLDGTQLGSGPVGCGPASRLLALLEALLGQSDDADRHFDQSVAFSRALMSPVWVARCQLEWAETLFERGETPTAARLTDEADAAAGDLALPALGRQWSALRDRLDPGVS